MIKRSLLAALFTLLTLPLAASQCEKAKEAGDGMVDNAREAHAEAIDDTGGWAGRQVDHTKGRLNNSANKALDKLNAYDTE